MGTQVDQHVFPSGLTLYRHWDDQVGVGVDVQCGDLATYQSWHDQLLHNSYEYYNQADGTNKFFRCVNLHIYTRWNGFPYAYVTGSQESGLTWNRGVNGTLPAHHSDITIEWFDPAGSGANGVPNSYRFPAAISHEMGHAYSNWAGQLYSDYTSSPEIQAMWEKLISSNHTVYAGNESQAPWTNDKPWEQYANTVRYFFGTYLSPGQTRGSSGPGTPDPVIAGFENPADHPDWRGMLMYLPELCAFIESYGVVPGTLNWNGWCFEFETVKPVVAGETGGRWVFQDYYYSLAGRTDGWHYWNDTSWVRFFPTYNRV